MHAVSNTRATALFFTVDRPITNGCLVERLPTARPGFSSRAEAPLNYAVTGDLAAGWGGRSVGGINSVRSRMF